MSERVRFTTTYMKPVSGRGLVKFGGEVTALSWDEAQKIADERTPPEYVDGVLEEEIFISDDEFVATKQRINQGHRQ